ncbi:hypothetical protein BJI47_22645 [Rhodococcus sp. 1168]|nr:hypothetical protein BJI47_22645 [Rhodococcus sp. 1168]
MSAGVERHDITITPHLKPEHEFGGACGKCGQTMFRTYYSDVEIMGQHKAIIPTRAPVKVDETCCNTR